MPKERSLITNKKDVRKANDILVLKSMTNTNEKNYVKTAPSLKGLQSKNLLPVEKQASKNFVDWYSDPATKQKFQKNTGLDPLRTQDLIAKGLQTPMVKYDESVSHAAPLGSSSEAEFRSPYVIKSIGDNLHQKTGYISYRPQSNNNYTSSLLNHELTHASGFDNVLAPALYRSLGLKLPEKTHGGLNYMDRPEEVYGNFHEFRQQLGLKPGQKVDTNSLNKMVKDSKINNNFWRTFSSDESGKENKDRIGKIANAINTIASVKDNNQNMNYSAYGGEINNKLNPKYNNYLNMRQYAQGGNLTRFDEGGTHESSPLGGIPQGVAPDGKQNTVEQGESKKGNFIYSNRIALDKGLVKQFNLPSYVANKSVSDASKAIDDKFKHRADKYAQETKNTLLDRLSQAQEYLKQQEQSQLEQTNQSMQSNSQQVPDMMNGQVPEGMEEYSQQESQQGQEMQGPQNIQTTSPIAAFGGYQQHRYSGLDNPNSEINVAPSATGTAGSTSPGAGAVIGAAGTAMDLGQLAFGKAAQDTSGLAASGRVGGAGMIGGSALKGAAAGAGFGPLGAAIGGGFGLLAGIAGLGKARAAETKNTTNFALNTNSQFRDQHAYGGNMNQYVKGGRAKVASVNELKPAEFADLKNAANINNLKFNTSNIKVPSKTPVPTLYQKAKIGLKDTGEYLSENLGDITRLAPVAMNAYQLKNLQKPTGFQYETLANRYKPQYVDEAQMQRIVDQEGNNTMSAIGQMGGSEGATRNAILAMGLNKTKGLSDAYANAAAQNRAQDAQAQQFNLGVDAQNVANRNRAIDEMRADKGAYDSAKSKFLSSIGTDIGDIGKEKNASDAAIAMFGYTRKGKYVVDKQGNIVSPETLAKRQADFSTYISEQNKKDNK